VIGFNNDVRDQSAHCIQTLLDQSCHNMRPTAG
jgi:hypothetical protein